MDYLALLKMLITNTDLDIYLDNNDKLNYAISYATSEISKRLGLSSTDTFPTKYGYNVVEGAKWYLATEGTEGESAHSENGVSRTYKTTPDWLNSIPSKVGVVKRNASTK